MEICASGAILWLNFLALPVSRTPSNECQEKNSKALTYAETVSQKLLTSCGFAYYTKYMANVLPIDKQIAVIIPPVVSSKTAVQAAIVQEARERGHVN